VGWLRRPQSVRFDMVTRVRRGSADGVVRGVDGMGLVSREAVSLARRDVMSSVSREAVSSRRELIGPVGLSGMIIRAPDSVRDTPTPTPTTTHTTSVRNGDGGLGERIKGLSLEDLPLKNGEAEEITQIMEDVDRGNGEAKKHSWALSKEEDVRLHPFPILLFIHIFQIGNKGLIVLYRIKLDKTSKQKLPRLTPTPKKKPWTR
jgi:hypothetical protein